MDTSLVTRAIVGRRWPVAGNVQETMWEVYTDMVFDGDIH